MEYLNFRIKGEFITQLAREKFHYENDPEYAKELLSECMISDQISEQEKEDMILAILDGRAELKGTYPDDDYGFRYLEEKDPKWDIERTLKKNEKKEMEAFNEAMLESYNLYDNEAKKQLLDSYLKRTKMNTKDDYGWLDPQGNFYPVEWGDHQKWADEWLRTNLSKEEYDKTECRYRLYNSGDVLCDRGWILLHNPAQGIADITESENHRRTKAQKEFLYDYYMERECENKANEIWDNF